MFVPTAVPPVATPSKVFMSGMIFVSDLEYNSNTPISSCPRMAKM